MKVVFMGTPEFAVPSLEAIHGSSHELAAVVTVSDKPIGRGLKVQPSPVKKAALNYGVPIFQPDDLLNQNFIKELFEIEADLFVVVAFRILPVEVFRIPPFGTINLHASLLPKYRGAAPINWAIINGETETGLSTIFIQERVDAGDLILQKRVEIGSDETAGELHDRLAIAGADLLLETIDQIADGTAIARQQVGEFTKAPKLIKELMRIYWSESAEKIRNLIRGLSPTPGAFSTLNGRMVKLLRAQAIEASGQDEPGRIILVDIKSGRIVVACESGALAINELQMEGKRPMSSKEYLIGHALNVGEKFS